MNIAFPFALDATGRSAAAGEDAHVRQMIEQLLLTARGERVNQPDLGSDLLQLVFGTNSDELASALQFTLQAALQKYLGDLIDVQSLDVRSVDASFQVSVQYVLRRTGDAAIVEFQAAV